MPGPAGFGDLGYCEVSVLPGGAFEHRLLFSTGIELVVVFRSFRLQRASIASPSVQQPAAHESVSGTPRYPHPEPKEVGDDEADSSLVGGGSQTVNRGEVPKFKLTIRNEGDAPERIIDLSGGRGPGLQDTYYDLEVTQGEKAVDMPRLISDPGPLVEQDFST